MVLILESIPKTTVTMPGIISDVTSIDTVSVHSVSEAFLGGSSPAQEALNELGGSPWQDDKVFGCIVVLAVLAGIASLPRLSRVAGPLFGSLWRWKETARLAASVPMSRDRNLLFLACLLPLSLLCARYGLYHISVMDGMAPWQTELTCLGAILLTVVMRYALVNGLEPRRISDQWKISRTNFPNCLIITTLCCLVASGTATMAGASDQMVRRVLLGIVCVLFGIFYYRNFEILSWKGQRFKGFSYLCALELSPVILLAISAVIF